MTSKDKNQDEPTYFVDYRESDVEVAMPGGTRNVALPLDYKIKGVRHKNPLEPPPPQFTKPALSRSTGELVTNPIAIYSKSDELKNGLLEVYPTILEHHQVPPEDWARFAEDVVIIAQQIPKRRKFLAGLNLASHSPNYHVYKLLMKRYGRMQYPLVKSLVQQWNQHYFNPRGLSVLFETPEDQWDVNTVQNPEYKRPRRRTRWNSFKRRQVRVISEDKTRLLITPMGTKVRRTQERVVEQEEEEDVEESLLSTDTIYSPSPSPVIA